MPFVSSQQSRVFAGSFAYSAYSRGYNSASTSAMLDVATLVDTAAAFIPGQTSSTSAITVLYDTISHAHGATWRTVDSLPVTFLPAGTALSAECIMVDSILTEFATTAPLTDVVAGSLSTTNTGPDDVGEVIAAFAAITATTTGTSVDDGASSANGGVAHLHVSAFSGLTSNTVRIEHSTNNSTWSTLTTFTAATGTTSQRLTIAAGTTVNRYLRVVDTVVGTGSCSRIVTFARR